MSKIYYGDTDRSGLASQDAWKSYGLDIDGKVTDPCSTDVCTLALGSSKLVQVDGPNGIDNSFGANLLPILTTFDSTFAQADNTAIVDGGSTTLLSAEHRATGPTFDPFPGSLLRAAPAVAPRWDGTDVRDIDRASSTGDSGVAALSFGKGYVAQGAWITDPPSASPALLDIGLQLGQYVSAPLLVGHVQVMTRLGDGGVASGVLSGILPTEFMVQWFHALAGSLSSSLCGATAFESIKVQIEQTSDIMVDGTNAPGAICNGISMGIGFDAVPVRLGTAVVVPSEGDPCADAGGD